MKTAFAAALALTLLSGTAMAAPNNDRHAGQNNAHQSQQHNQQVQTQTRTKTVVKTTVKTKEHVASRDHDRDGRKGHDAKRDDRKYSYNGKTFKAVHAPAWKAPKGHQANRHWNRGQQLPAFYRARAYQVNPHHYHLKPAPRGHQWVRVQNNVYLVQNTNGLISQIVFNMFY